MRRFTSPPDRALSTLSLGSLKGLFWTLRVLVSGLLLTLSTVREQRENIRHIFALWVIPCGLWARLACWRYGVKYSTWALGSDIWSFKDRALFRPLLRLCLRGATHRYADGLQLGQDVEDLSARTCKFLASSRVLPPLNATVVREAQGTSLRYLGRWHHNKGVDILLAALALLEDQAWEQIGEVIIAGGGPDQAQVLAMIEQLKQQRRPVVARGYLDREQAARFIADADYLVLPSRIESIPVILSDALHCGTPLIMTPVGDLPELHRDHEVGLICEAVSAEALKIQICRALNADPAEFMVGRESLQQRLSLDRTVSGFLEDIGIEIAATE